MSMNGGAVVSKKRIPYVIYAALVLCLAFSLGYLLGYDKGETNIQVTTVAPVIAQEQENASMPVAPVAENAPININTASDTELQQLPGIGPELAKRIIAYRTEHGGFVSTEQIMDVQGIGQKRYESMENLITIGETQ